MLFQNSEPADSGIRQHMKPVRRNFYRFTLPSLASMIVYSLYTMVDGFFVAHYNGAIALASVNLAMPIVNSFFALGILFAIGSQARCAVLLGQGKTEEASRHFTQSFIAAACSGVMMAILGLSFLPQITRLLGAGPWHFDLVSGYLRIVLCFAPLFVISYTMEVMIKTDGFPRLSALGVLGSALVNIVLDAYFVGGLSWGVQGAALATGLSQLFSFLFFLGHFLFGRSRLHFVRTRLSFKTAMQMAKLGLGDFISEIGIGFTVFIYNIFIIRYIGVTALPIFSVISYVQLFVDTCFLGIAQGILPLISSCLGKGDKESARYTMNLAVKAIAILSVLMFALCWIFPSQIFSLFFPQESVDWSSGIQALRIFSISFLFGGYNILMAAYSVALLHGKTSMRIHFCRTTLFLFLSLYALSFIGGTAIWYGAGLAQILTLLLPSLSCYVRRHRLWRDASQKVARKQA